MRQITKQEIITQLKKLGITEGTELEVHSSLSSFGYVEGGELAVIDALKETVTESGSIFMPALRLSPDLQLDQFDINNGVIRKIKVLSEKENKSRCGIIADTFRSLPNTKTQDGVFGIAAWGANADKVKTGLKYLIDHHGKALLMGVDIYSLTAMHYVENHLPKEISELFKTGEIDELYHPDKWLVENGEAPVKAWYKIQDKAFELGLIKEHMIGESKCMYFDIASVINIYKNELINDAFDLYGIKK